MDNQHMQRYITYVKYNISLIEKVMLEANSTVLGSWSHNVHSYLGRLDPIVKKLKKTVITERNRGSVQTILNQAYYFSTIISNALYHIKMGRAAHIEAQDRIDEKMQGKNEEK